MPRINAESVAEHVAQQEAAVLGAAVRLFTERGYAEVTLADVAAEVGLARNSLYRYFPDKAHILVRWLRRELPLQAERSRERLTSAGPPLERIDAWALDQLDYAHTPEHRLIAALPEAARGLDADTRTEITAIHEQIFAPLAEALADAAVPESDRPAVVHLLGGLVLAAANREARTGVDPVLRGRLRAAIAGLVAGSSAATHLPALDGEHDGQRAHEDQHQNERGRAERDGEREDHG